MGSFFLKIRDLKCPSGRAVSPHNKAQDDLNLNMRLYYAPAHCAISHILVKLNCPRMPIFVHQGPYS